MSREEVMYSENVRATHARRMPSIASQRFSREGFSWARVSVCMDPIGDRNRH